MDTDGDRGSALPTDGVVALCGLGNMGAAIASRLVRSYRVIGFDLDAARREDARRMGVQVVDEAAELAQASVVILSLPVPAISLNVVTALAPGLKPGSVIVETSTVNPADMATLVGAAGESAVVDAAILSGVAGMSAGNSTLLTGGDGEVLDRLDDMFGTMSSRIIRIGPSGSAMAAKVINNAVAHAVMVVLVEASTMAVKSGLRIEQLVDLLRDPNAGLIRPLTHRVADRVMNADYDGGMPTEAARKDSTLALQLAQSVGVPLFAIQGAHTAYELALAQDLGRLDYAAIAKLWEHWTGASLVAGGGPVTKTENAQNIETSESGVAYEQ
ncbi:NAD(P)-dependent oxidoreductase [Cryobacterium sp. Y82]|uniref:NAD(P)-dependent oxidoreductase n=1 Tax=Cryobacterium sp. Y82 TaxID=2045017 RepID=UPI001E59BC3A|nr:NAD(P)-dependent oxidoreductase [Cryobacterium sp. Y82]